MIFRTELSIPPSAHQIQHIDEIMTFGSCFSEHIGHRLQKYKFKCISNPFGTVFNPISISRLLLLSSGNQQVETNSLNNIQGLWVHPDFHSKLSHWDQKIAAEKINNTLANIHQAIHRVKYLFITLGTAWAYRQKSSGQIVANCHKMQASSFDKVHLDIDAGYNAMSDSFQTVMKMNPSISFILTISPVRHIKDGIVENSLSKARLHSIAEKLTDKYKNVSYFPAFEWMMDDLRDYRFYEADMIHPNEVAIDYIWQKFGAHFFKESTSDLIKKIDSILKAVIHRPFNPSSQEHITFINHQLRAIQSLQKDHPYLDFRDEEKALVS